MKRIGRRLGVALVATMGDPALIEPLPRRAQVDPDERIQRLAERLIRPANLREIRSDRGHSR